ncbi:flagellar export chaperone FliS [Brenneria goodwinii]|uniref:Flagellar secretion chaperone FliS n=1 Tax=Brenneria goodwinii TaxID=1109412 RepID=A0AAE8ES51_9GAMM|nr:flagellar export chaperone FliS [Brenneria goodwinii]ATA24376.1 flagellar protein FliS [Brenneria goodwinii]RLM29482.1 flagellar export chaperone FliS [Brenneria goodwinii]
MYSRTGSQAYARIGVESSVMSASPHQLIVLLFDGARSAMVRARILLQQGDIQGKGMALSKAINIITNGLKAGLDTEKGGELAENLSALYDYMTQRLMMANLHNDVKIIEEVEGLLENIADAWRQIGPNYQPAQEA